MAELSNEQKQEVKVTVAKEVEKKIEKEVKKRLHERVSIAAVSSAKRFKDEFKKQTVTAITAAFAFLIALIWRTPIQKSVDKLVISLGLNQEAVYYDYIAAVIITVVGVLALIILSRWAVEKK